MTYEVYGRAKLRKQVRHQYAKQIYSGLVSETAQIVYWSLGFGLIIGGALTQ
jgi:hypothetical protein